jgi:Holliday junction resolvase-like predicted endonuclease
MLNENQVVDAICAYLETRGYAVLSKCTTTVHGIDIVAKSPPEVGGRLLVEAKGGTSAREGSARYEKGFNRSQVFDRVAKAFYTAVCLLQEHQSNGDQVALAFPDTGLVREYLGRIATVLGTLRVAVFLVGEDLAVTIL